MSLRFGLFSFMVFAFSAQASDLLTVYNDALLNNAEYRISQSQLKISDEYKINARGLLLPQLNVQASYTELENTYTTGNPLLSTASNIDTTTTEWQVSLEQTLINFSDWYGFKSGGAKSDLGKVQFAQASQQLLFESMQHYLQVMSAHEDLNVSVAEEKALEKQLKRLKDHHDVGMVAVTDLYEGQAAFDLAAVNVLKAQRSLESSYKRLTAFTGKSYRELSYFDEAMPTVFDQHIPIEKWLETARAYNHDLLIADKERVAADYEYKQHKLSHLPTLSASFHYGDADIDGEQYTGNIDGSAQETQQIALTLKVPIYLGGRVSSKARTAAANRDIAKDKQVGLRRDIEEEVKGLFQDLSIQILQINAMYSSVDSTAKLLNASTAGFEQGTRSLLDVLTAQSSHYDAQRDLVQARLSFVELLFKFKKVCGVLSIDDLDYYNSWLHRARVY